MSEFCLPVRVYYEDTDAAGVVYYANYLRFIERARTDWLRTLGVDQGALMQSHGIAFAVRALEADYFKPGRLDDELMVRSTLEEVGRAQVVFRQNVMRGEELLFSARVRVVSFDPATARAAAIPKAVQEKFKEMLSERSERVEGKAPGAEQPECT
ncbi:MAG TPA: tol-pal system-associated acyl-CoA thioesterase [Rhodocyclaceae bacterium]|nr:tol-pal system-associated acyl-CoA thioesterase [Rhodocyclaceae bacterium]